jgi:hypothetical protein
MPREAPHYPRQAKDDQETKRGKRQKPGDRGFIQVETRFRCGSIPRWNLEFLCLHLTAEIQKAEHNLVLFS